MRHGSISPGLAQLWTPPDRWRLAMSDLKDEIGTLLDRYVAHWNAWEMDAVRGLWDPDEAEPIYVAEESPALVGWDALLVLELRLDDVVVALQGL